MDIRTKMILGFCAMLVLILSMCVMSIEYLTNIREDSKFAVKQTEIAGLSSEIEIALLEARQAQNDYRQTRQRRHLENFKKQIEKIKEKNAQIRSTDSENAFLEELKDIDMLVNEYEAGFLKAQAKPEAGQSAQPMSKQDLLLEEAARKLQNRVYPIVGKAKNNRERAIGWAEVTNMQAITTILLLGLTAVITGIWLTYYIPKQVTQSTGKLLDAMKKIEAGEWKARAQVKSGDEMEILGEYFNRMLDTLDEARRRVSNAEKLASLGTLSAGIAHEINNPLTGILTSAHIVLKHLPKGHESREDMEVIISETLRCRDIVKGLLNFAREAKAELTSVDVNIAVEKALALVKNQEAYREINIIRNMQQNLPKVLADGNRLEQVFLNIIINAREAMRGRGELEIISLYKNGFVEVSVKDSGCGIPEENIDKVCDPFFTTKEPGKGTGLGLAVTYGIIKEYSGILEIESKEGLGTTVVVKFSAADDKGENRNG